MKKAVIAAVSAVVLIVFIVILLILTKNISLRESERTIEYGTTLDFDAAELLNTDDLRITDTVHMDMSEISYEEEKDYPAVGEYTVYIQGHYYFRNFSLPLKVTVSDTTAPEFDSSVDDLKILVGEQINIEKHFSCSDLSGCTLEMNTDQVDFNTAGVYSASVTATDIHDNAAVKEFTITVQEKPTPNQPTTPSESGSIQPTFVNGILIVNKKHPISSDYASAEDPTAKAQIKKLISDMQMLGYDISSGYSGFRSYNYQKNLYWNYVSSYGQTKADTFSARPGYSEHQSGLAFDLLHQDGTLVTDADEVKWIAENAHQYGFIVRYQAGKEGITGYQAEPWHLRYIGDKAEAIYRSGLTLEEYLGVEGGDYHQ